VLLELSFRVDALIESVTSQADRARAGTAAAVGSPDVRISAAFRATAGCG
jgi:hypothetical protein